jgi:hypothetical protein
VAVPTQTFTFHKVSDWQWVTGHIAYFWSLSRTHLYLALVAVFFGLLIALPLGALATQVPRSYPPILVVTTILYALPSLAVFAFLVGVTGLTDTTVIIPLTAYAVAILVRSVADGLRNVPEEVRVAAVAMGFRPLSVSLDSASCSSPVRTQTSSPRSSRESSWWPSGRSSSTACCSWADGCSHLGPGDRRDPGRRLLSGRAGLVPDHGLELE